MSVTRVYSQLAIQADQSGSTESQNSIIFYYASSSYNNLFQSGALATIKTKTLEATAQGARGELEFVVSTTGSGITSSGVPIMTLFHTGSNNEPRVGVGFQSSEEVKRTFEIQSKENSSTGTEIVLKSGRPNLGAEIGDLAGSITFVIESSSFSDPFLTGSVTQIDTVIRGTGSSDNMTGNLRIHASPEWIEVMQPVAEFGYRHRTGESNDSSAMLYVSGALIVGGENSSQGDLSPLEVYGRQTTGQSAPTSQIIYSGSEFHLYSGSLHVGSGSISLGATYGDESSDIEFVNFRGQGPIKLGQVSGGAGSIHLDLYSNNTQQARLDTSGNFGIGTGTSTLNNKLEVAGDISASGDITTNTISTISTVIGSDSATNVDTFVTATYKGATYDYILYDAGVGARTGQFMVIQDNSNIEFTDTSTPTLGTESSIPSITADISGSNVRVRVTNGNGYTFKAIAKKL